MYLTKEPVKLDRAASSVNVAFVILTVLVIAVNFLEDIPLLIYYHKPPHIASSPLK